MNSSIVTDFYSENGQWTLQDSSMTNGTLLGNPTCIHLDINISRRSVFFVIYLIIPILFLAFINNLVFIMPANSGERMSVSITTFLSFVVYMGIVSDNVPNSSAPMSYLYFYLLFLILYSSVILFLCVLSLRIYDNETEVPHLLQRVIYFLRFRCCKRQDNGRIAPCSSNGKSINENNVTRIKSVKNKEGIVVVNSQTMTDNEITWRVVGKTFDLYCAAVVFVIFLGMTLLTFIRFRLCLNKGLA